MKRIQEPSSKTILTMLCLALLPISASAQNSLWGNLDKGEYNIGFTTFYQYGYANCLCYATNRYYKFMVVKYF